MSEKRRMQSGFARAAAAAWIVVPVAWGISTLLDDGGSGDTFSVLGALGWAALVVAGVLMMLAALELDATPTRTRIYQAGIVAHGLAILVTIPMFWAVPVWAGLYTVAMVAFAISIPSERPAMLVIAGAMVGGIACLYVLTALEVGTPDPTYGDYPIAWTASFTVAAVGAAIGSILMGRSGAPIKQAPEVLV